MNYSKKIPNKLGIPMKKNESGKIQKAHSIWKNEIAKRKCKDYFKMSYWQRKSTCTAL